METIKKLQTFVNQRPGLEYCNYGDPTSYRAESREITADRRDFYEVLNFALIEIPDLENRVKKALENNTGRLTLENGRLEYCTGQYFPTEYRPAATRILTNIIWNHIRETKFSGPNHEARNMREYFKKVFSRRVCKYYFN